MADSAGKQAPSIWWFAFGYFACYVPYSALTKALTDGRFHAPPIDGLELLPITAIASMVGMFTFISAIRWWSVATRHHVLGFTLALPTRWTFLSGLATAAIIATTTLAYTFHGESIVFMVLLMKGGVLVIAPMIDFLTRRRVHWFSWIALGLSLSALVVTFEGEDGGFHISTPAVLDIAVYLLGYFVRLRFMSRLAKSDDPNTMRRYFVEEQMTATPALVCFLGAAALFGRGEVAAALARGFGHQWHNPLLWLVLLVGVLSQGTGVFGGLILLDRRENTFCVPVNRASSVLAGVLATVALGLAFGTAMPPHGELVGALLVIAAVVVLSMPTLLAARARKGKA
jgi:hypothetical protein